MVDSGVLRIDGSRSIYGNFKIGLQQRTDPEHLLLFVAVDSYPLNFLTQQSALFLAERYREVYAFFNNIYARKPRTSAYGFETMSLPGQNLWRNLLLHTNKSQSLKALKRALRLGVSHPTTVDCVRIYCKFRFYLDRFVVLDLCRFIC